MSELLGVAFSSPAVVPLLVDNEKFMVHAYDGAKDHYRDYLAVRESRKKIVLVPNVKRLVQAQELDPEQRVDVYMLFDRVELLSCIPGCLIVDGEPDTANPSMWHIKTDKIKKEELNTLLDTTAVQNTGFNVPIDIYKKTSLLEPSLVDFISQVTASIENIGDGYEDSFKYDTLSWVCGAMNTKEWIALHKESLTTQGANEDLALDLYRYCAEGSAAKSLWKAFHAMQKKGVTLEDAATKYQAHAGDLQVCATLFKPYKKKNFKYAPKKKDLEVTDA